MPLRGKIALITGAGRGIGRAIALAMAERGVHPALCARTIAEIEGVAEECRAFGVRAHAFAGDVSVIDDVQRIVSSTESALGRIDILVNNAGVFRIAPVLDTAPDILDEMLAVNVCGPIHTTRAVLPGMIGRDDGVIINIGSLAGRKGYAGQSAYCASKHALLGFTRALAIELAQTRIRVTMLSPGGVDTGLIAAARPGLDRSTWMNPEDIAEAVVYVASLPEKMAIDEIVIRRRAADPSFV